MTETGSHEKNTPGHSQGPFLEMLTAGVLLLVCASLVWMGLGACFPALVSWVAMETQIIIILALLTGALLLVSAVALLHTRES